MLRSTLYLCFLLLFCSTFSVAQDSNAWIDYSKPYFRIPIVKKGVYRLSYQELKTAGMPTGVNPQGFQLFRRGKEQAIFVQGESDATFDEGDFVEFYAEPNDGKADSSLYIPAKAQPHAYFPLYSDTAVYFLTYQNATLKGKRMQVLSSSSQQTAKPLTFHEEEIVQVMATTFSSGMMYPIGIREEGVVFSHFDTGEGYFSTPQSTGVPFESSFVLSQFQKNTDLTPTFTGQLVGITPDAHQVEWRVGSRILGNSSWENYETPTFQQTLRSDDFTSNKLSISTLSKDGYTKAYSLAYLKLTYPQGLDLVGAKEKNFHFWAKETSSAVLQNVPTSALVYDISDLGEVKKLKGLQNGTNLTLSLIGKDNRQEIYVTDQVQKVVFPIQKIAFRALSKKANYLIISHPKLMRSVASSANPVREYAAYRASEAGGKYDTLVVTVQELYDQFNYGELSPLAIKQFLAYMYNVGNPQQVFIIGTSQWLPTTRFDVNRSSTDLIPNAGYPCSDMPYVLGLDPQNPYLPVMGIGRLNTSSPQVVLDYLSKVKEHEQVTETDTWRKNIVMLGGGGNQYEHLQFQGYLKGFGQVASTGFTGVNYQLFTKKSDEGVEVFNISNQLNSGVSLINFFGHAGFNVVDLDIGSPSNDLMGYRNKGRYPLFLVNGCESGNFYNGKVNIGTDWVNTANRGAILFLGHAWFGYPFALKSYTENLYHSLYADSTTFDKPFGTIQRKAIERYLSKEQGDFTIGNIEQFVLQGDPAIRLFPFSKPDYATTNSDVYVAGIKEVAATSDSLDLRLMVRNLGRTDARPLKVTITRTYPDASQEVMTFLSLKPVRKEDTLKISLANDKLKAVGTNTFLLEIDKEQVIAEGNETNNTALLTYTITSPNATVLYPLPYSVVGTTKVTMQFQLPDKQVINVLEIDTTQSFNSAVKITKTLAGKGFVTSLVNLLAKDSLVYYARLVENNKVLNSWSFRYVNGLATGWSKASLPQFEADKKEQLILKNAQYQFVQSTRKIEVQSIGAHLATTKPFLSVDNQEFVPAANCGGNAFLTLTFKGESLEPFSPFSSWNQTCRTTDARVGVLHQTLVKVQNLLTTYLDELAEGDYVLISTYGYTMHKTYLPLESRIRLAQLGADTARLMALPDGSPYILLARKGSKKPLVELFPDPKSTTPFIVQKLALNYTLNSAYRSGSITSTAIGEASAWEQMDLKVANTASAKQFFSTDIIGVNTQGTETLLKTNLVGSTHSLKDIDARLYPKLKIRVNVQNLDESLLPNAPQLKEWLVRYKPVPEGVIRADASSISTKQEYEPMNVRVYFKNSSTQAFKDSLVVRQVLTNRTQRKQAVKLLKVKPLAGNDSLAIDLSIETGTWSGENVLSVFVNPQVQLEQNYTNNSLDLVYQVEADKQNPLLEVSFDGKQIANNAIVSKEPLIQIRLKDENLYRIRKDTTGIDLWLKACSKCSFKRIYFSNSLISWKIADENNDFRINYRPNFIGGDTLTLQVQGTDVAGNTAGVQPYRVTFRVIAEDGLQKVQVYPNPATTYTKFVFTLTGSTLPETASIEVFDAFGRVVYTKDFQKEDLRIGSNEWYLSGEQLRVLPNDLYFYRVKIGDYTPTTGKLLIAK